MVGNLCKDKNLSCTCMVSMLTVSEAIPCVRRFYTGLKEKVGLQPLNQNSELHPLRLPQCSS